MACWFNAGKTHLVLSDWFNNSGAIYVKMSASLLEEKSSFKMMELFFSSNRIGFLTLLQLLKLPPRKLELWFVLWSFFLSKLIFSSDKSTIQPDMEYYCHVWAIARSCYLDMLDKLQKRVCRTVSPTVATPLEH